MATTQHPTHVSFGYHGNHEWLWIGLTAILVGMVAAAIVWAVSRPETTTSTATAEAVSGFEYSGEATPIHEASPGVTTEYYGNSGELYPEEVAAASVYSTPRFDPMAAADAGLNPGLIDAAVGGSTAPARTVEDQATIDMLAPAITQEFMDANVPVVEGTRQFDPIAAADAGLNPGLIDAAVGGTVATIDWDAVGGPYQDGTVADYYIGDTTPVVDPADIKFLQNN